MQETLLAAGKERFLAIVHSLFNEKTGMLVREVFSDPVTGAYEFLYVSMDHKYTVVTFDYDNNYRAVVADNITAEFAP